jgi:small subunit ribosomal protein S1
VSLKSLAPDPFETKINNYKVGDICSAKVIRLTDYGAFVSLEEGLEGLCHQTELSFSNRNISAKKLFSISQTINVKIMEIDKMKRRISLSYRATQINPWEKFAKEFKVGSKVDGIINNKNEFSLFVNIKDYDLTGVVNYKDLSWSESGEEQLKKFKINDPITTRVLEFDKDKQKCRLGVKQCQPDPMDYFKNKKEKKDIITVIVKETLDTGIKVTPIGCLMDILIIKNKIAINKQDQRPNRFNRGDKVDVMLESLNLKTRKVILSIKMLEEAETKQAIARYGSMDSGKSLPFAQLPEALKKKNKTKEK